MDVRNSRHTRRRSDPPQMDPSLFLFPKPPTKLKEVIRRDHVVLVSRRVAMSHQATDVETKKLYTQRSSSCSPTRVERRQYDQVMGELEVVKRELNKLKVGMASILQTKFQSSASHHHIQALGHEESSEFSFSMEEIINKKTEQLQQEKLIHPDQSNEQLVHELTVTLADASLVQKGLKLAKEDIKDSSKELEDNSKLALIESLETSQILASITQELEAAKKELASVREEGFQFTSSMDIIRNELKRVTEEIARLKKADVKAKSLSTKLPRAKSKLETASAAEAKTKSALINLSLTLEQLQSEAQVSEKEKSHMSEETEVIEAEIQKTESEISASEIKLLSAMEALEDVKSSEALTLEKLKSLIETSTRVYNCLRSPTITISKFEYEYLTEHAIEAEEIADKKVAAAQAWIEAFKASEKEVVMKIEMAQREIRMEEDPETGRIQRRRSGTSKDDRESGNLGEKQERITNEEHNLHYSNYKKKYVRQRGKTSPYGRREGKLHKSTSSASLRSTPIIIKKDQKVMLKLGKIFSGNKTGIDV